MPTGILFPSENVLNQNNDNTRCDYWSAPRNNASVSELQCQYQPWTVACRLRSANEGNTHFCGTFPVSKKVIYTFLYYYVIDNRRYI